jgi:hypothetical protein
MLRASVCVRICGFGDAIPGKMVSRTLNFFIFVRLKKRIAHILSLILLTLHAGAQNGITGSPQWQIKPVFNTGFIVVHRISIGHLVKGYPGIYELNISKPSYGNKLWQVENNHPDMGLTLQCLDFRNPQQLGYALTAAPYIEIPLSKKENWWRLHMRLCWGITYITKSFDIQENHKNIAIGSHVNVFAQFRWFMHMKLSERLRFEPGITFSHGSNGRTQNPNLGLNVLSVGAGLNILLNKPVQRYEGRLDSSTRVRKKNEIIAVAAWGYNEHVIRGNIHNCYLLSVAYQRNVRNTHKFSLGADLFLDGNYGEDYFNRYGYDPTGLDKFRISVRAGYSYNVGRVSFPLEIGYYVFDPLKPDAPVTSRVGIRYYDKTGIIGQFGLRTHFAVAYNFEFGLGYRFYIGK